MKYYIIAGEASGDLHGSNLIKSIKNLDTKAAFRVWGGDKMKAETGALVTHYKDIAYMGFLEVILHLPKILMHISKCKKDITAFQPDVIVLVDYPGFNLRIAEWAYQKEFKIAYYISPQLWAWKESRLEKIKQFVHQMMVVLPFEKQWYMQRNVDVTFVGHPLLDVIDKVDLNQDKTCIALLPGSRKQEIQRKLPIMLQVASRFPNEQFVVAGLASNPPSFYEQIGKYSNVSIEYNQTYDILKKSKAAVVTSGTATLETALFEVPQIAVYKSSWISFQIAKRLVKLNSISLVNLISEQHVIPELIQQECNVKSISNLLHELLKNEPVKQDMISRYKMLKQKLGGPGASNRAGNLVHLLAGLQLKKN